MHFIGITALYLALVNLIAYWAFAHDKNAARNNARRIPENTLLMLALIGGSPATVFAQQQLRHKTRKQPFRAFLIAIIILQTVAVMPILNAVFNRF